MQTNLRQDALEILEAGLSALDPQKILDNKTKIKFHFDRFSKIYIIGAGKGVRFLAQRLEEILGEKIVAGFVNDKEKLDLKKIVVNKAGHPLPDKASFAGTQKMLNLIKNISKNDLIICLIAGGGSSLLTWPTFAVRRTAEFYDKLLKSGANIYEMNVIRKHIDRVKGGGLAAFIYPKPCISLIISDVPGNNLETIASGPTVYDKSTKEDTEEIINKYKLPKIPLIETPKDKNLFKKVENILLANNKIALLSMQNKAEKLGYQPKILDDSFDKRAESVGQFLFKNLKPNQVLIVGGETTVKVKGKGRGGRNTHLCLAALKYLPKNTCLAAINSDGEDNTDAAGAVITGETIKKAKQLNLASDKFLQNFDSYHFFEKTGDLIKTGPLPINVGDLILVLKRG